MIGSNSPWHLAVIFKNSCQVFTCNGLASLWQSFLKNVCQTRGTHRGTPTPMRFGSWQSFPPYRGLYVCQAPQGCCAKKAKQVTPFKESDTQIAGRLNRSTHITGCYVLNCAHSILSLPPWMPRSHQLSSFKHRLQRCDS